MKINKFLKLKKIINNIKNIKMRDPKKKIWKIMIIIIKIEKSMQKIQRKIDLILLLASQKIILLCINSLLKKIKMNDICKPEKNIS